MRVKVGDKVVNFPETMSKEEVGAALRKKFTKREKEQIIKEVIKEVPQIVEKEIIKEVKVPQLMEIVKEAPLSPVIEQMLMAIKGMLNKPPVEVREIQTDIVMPESPTKWTFEVTERDSNNNILVIEARSE